MFGQAVQNEMASVPKKMISKLCASLPKRLAQVIENCGEKIKY
jgi:hypothetical protein